MKNKAELSSSPAQTKLMPLRYKILLSQLLVIIILSMITRNATSQDFPRRIVSLGPINTENLFLLGAGDRLVADTIYCVRPLEAKNRPKIGSVMQVSIEKIIAMRPDLILATALTRSDQIDQLTNMGFKVVKFRQPRSFKEICQQFNRLGSLLGLDKKAAAIIKKTKKEVRRIQLISTNLLAPKVFLQVGAQPLFGAVPGSFINDFITLAGGINIIANQRSGTSKLEKIISLNPDIIIIAIMGSETGIAAQERDNWHRFSIIKAVKDNRVEIINPDLVCSPSPATFAKTLKIIAKMIHPGIEDNQ